MFNLRKTSDTQRQRNKKTAKERRKQNWMNRWKIHVTINVWNEWKSTYISSYSPSSYHLWLVERRCFQFLFRNNFNVNRLSSDASNYGVCCFILSRIDRIFNVDPFAFCHHFCCASSICSTSGKIIILINYFQQLFHHHQRNCFNRK